MEATLLENFDINLIWMVLLPLAAASGWWLGNQTRSDSKKGQKRIGDLLSRDYIKGLNYLVNDETDRALQVFIRLVEVDNETVETHLALGSLFRRRGEVDRALRIHQNLTARPNLPVKTRQQALLELARDYIAAGVMDRAEDLLKELYDQGAYEVIALRSLLNIYEQQKDWSEAIAVAFKLKSLDSRDVTTRIAHYYCELGDIALRSGDTKTAKLEFKRALNVDEDNPRANIALGQAALAQGEIKLALRTFRKITNNTPDFTPEILGHVIDCYVQSNDPDGLRAELLRISHAYTGVGPTLLLLSLAESRNDMRTFDSVIQDYAASQPTLPGMGKIFDQLVNGRELAEVVEQLRTLKVSLGATMKQLPDYQCNKCGFEAKHIHWRCPSCKSWGLISPLPHRAISGQRALMPGGQFSKLENADNVVSFKKD